MEVQQLNQRIILYKKDPNRITIGCLPLDKTFQDSKEVFSILIPITALGFQYALKTPVIKLEYSELVNSGLSWSFLYSLVPAKPETLPGTFFKRSESNHHPCTDYHLIRGI